MNTNQTQRVNVILAEHKDALDGVEECKLAELYDQDLVNLEAEGEDMRTVNFQRSILLGAKLKASDLSGSSFSGCFMANADLSQCNLSGVNFTHANLFQVNLDNANLAGAKLQGTVGNLKQIKTMHLETYPVTYTKDVLSIGCFQMPMYIWRGADNAELWKGINKDLRAFFVDEFDFAWWDKWKETIFNIIDMSPAE